MKARSTAKIIKEYGLSWALWRASYTAALRSGYLRHVLPEKPSALGMIAKHFNSTEDQTASLLAEMWETDRKLFFFAKDISSFNKGIPRSFLDDSAANILNGGIKLFSQNHFTLVGNPPNWFLSEGGRQPWPSDIHWTHIPDLSLERGDIKFVWEISRFSHAFTLVRAFAASGGDDRYAQAFWDHFEDWENRNAIEKGPHWRCAQEMSFRCLAWLFALHGFRRSKSTTPERIGRMLAQIWVHGQHIAKIHWYSKRCIKNNHAISEALVLYTIGRLFPFLPNAEKWEKKGRASFCEEVAWQVRPDGSYIQHSNNYSRLVGQLLTWAIALSKVQGDSLPSVVEERARALYHFLLAQQDPISGMLPNYGSNDGTLLFPLSECSYSDFRPLLNSLGTILGIDVPFGPGPWEEDAFWFGLEPSKSPALKAEDNFQVSNRFDDGGYYVLRGLHSHGVIRCTKYRSRPAQADMLNFDFWYHGKNILPDPGTYSYNSADGWRSYFVGSGSHNTVTIDGRDQMERGPRFTWLNWTQGSLTRFKSKGERTIFSGFHTGYFPAIHERQVLRSNNLYFILDLIRGSKSEQEIRLHWLLDDFPIQPSGSSIQIFWPEKEIPPLAMKVLCSLEAKAAWCRADQDSRRGFQSRQYLEMKPAWSGAWTVQAKEARFLTVFGPLEEVEKLNLPSSKSLPQDLGNGFEQESFDISKLWLK